MKNITVVFQEEAINYYQVLKRQYSSMRFHLQKLYVGNVHTSGQILNQIDNRTGVKELGKNVASDEKTDKHRNTSAHWLYHSPDRYNNRSGGQKRPR